MITVPFPLKPGAPEVGFKFTIPNVRQLELAAGCGIDLLRLRGQTVHAMVLMTCYGLKWEDRKMTPDVAEGLIQKYLEHDGKVEDLMEALVKALNGSTVYGEVKTEAAEEGDENPSTAKT